MHAIEAGRLRTARGDVRADVVVRATEAFTPELPGLRRTIAPDLLADDRDRTAARTTSGPRPGSTTRPTFADFRHMIIYGQRTADGRFAFGGRGTPYHFGSRVRPRVRPRPARLRLSARHPALAVPRARRRRDHEPLGWRGRGPARLVPVGGLRPRRAGIAWAGGYVGDGVEHDESRRAHLADLVLGHDTELVRLPWVGHRSPRWEPEPLRWLGVNLSRKLVESVDRAEAAGRDPRWRARAMDRILG